MSHVNVLLILELLVAEIKLDEHLIALFAPILRRAIT